MTWEEWVAAADPRARGMLLAFGALVDDVAGGTRATKRTEVQFRDKRIFAVAFVRSGRLEVALDLLRPADHPRLIARFPTTRRVLTHRLTFESEDQLDDALSDLIAEAFDTVGPGTRGRTAR